MSRHLRCCVGQQLRRTTHSTSQIQTRALILDRRLNPVAHAVQASAEIDPIRPPRLTLMPDRAQGRLCATAEGQGGLCCSEATEDKSGTQKMTPPHLVQRTGLFLETSGELLGISWMHRASMRYLSQPKNTRRSRKLFSPFACWEHHNVPQLRSSNWVWRTWYSAPPQKTLKTKEFILLIFQHLRNWVLFHTRAALPFVSKVLENCGFSRNTPNQAFNPNNVCMWHTVKTARFIWTPQLLQTFPLTL